MTTAQKQAAISKMIIANVNNGMEINEAFDAVMGEGAYAKVASTVYHALRAKK